MTALWEGWQEQTFDTNGKFGPFTGQYFIPDVIQPLILRANFEKVNGVYQGAVFTFYRGTELGGGSHKIEFDKEGVMWVGQTARGWGKGEGLKKIKWNGKTSMDVKAMNMVKGGFKISFTKAADQQSASDSKQLISISSSRTSKISNSETVKSKVVNPS